jgi:hypothetical protein
LPLGRRCARVPPPRRLERPAHPLQRPLRRPSTSPSGWRNLLAPPPSRAAGAPAPPRAGAPSTGPPWGRSGARPPRAACATARRAPPAPPRSAPWRPGRCAAAGRPTQRGRARRGAPPAAPPSAGRTPAPRPRPPLRQQPGRLRVPRLGHVPSRPVAPLQLRDRQVLDNPRHGPAPKPGPSAYPFRACQSRGGRMNRFPSP